MALKSCQPRRMHHPNVTARPVHMKRLSQPPAQMPAILVDATAVSPRSHLAHPSSHLPKTRLSGKEKERDLGQWKGKPLALDPFPSHDHGDGKGPRQDEAEVSTPNQQRPPPVPPRDISAGEIAQTGHAQPIIRADQVPFATTLRKPLEIALTDYGTATISALQGLRVDELEVPEDHPTAALQTQLDKEPILERLREDQTINARSAKPLSLNKGSLPRLHGCKGLYLRFSTLPVVDPTEIEGFQTQILRTGKHVQQIILSVEERRLRIRARRQMDPDNRFRLVSQMLDHRHPLFAPVGEGQCLPIHLTLRFQSRVTLLLEDPLGEVRPMWPELRIEGIEEDEILAPRKGGNGGDEKTPEPHRHQRRRQQYGKEHAEELRPSDENKSPKSPRESG